MWHDYGMEKSYGLFGGVGHHLLAAWNKWLFALDQQNIGDVPDAVFLAERWLFGSEMQRIPLSTEADLGLIQS